MSSAEFTLWQAYDRIDPWGDERRQMALLAAVIANVYRKKGAKAFTADDFLPIARQPASSLEIWTAFEAAIAGAAGRPPQTRTDRRELLELEGLHLGSTLPASLQPKLE